MELAVARVIEAHPDLTAARASRAVAAFELRAARALPSPEFRITANNFTLDPEGLDLRNSIAWRWSPPRPRELSLKSKVADARRRAVDADIRTAELRIAAAVRQSYRRAAIAQQRAELAARAVELRQSVLDVTRRQVATGLKEAVESDLAELAHADAESALQRAQSAAALERRRLARHFDPSGAAGFSLVPESVPAPTHTRDGLVERALQGRPELMHSAATCEAAAEQLTLAANGRYPWIKMAQVTRRLGSETTGRTGSWGFQVGIDLPVFRSAAHAETRIARAETERCRLEAQALRARIRREVEDAADQWQAALTELAKLDQLAAGPAARALEHTRAALAAGRADRAELLLAEARQLALRDRSLERRLDLAALEAQLELAAGL